MLRLFSPTLSCDGALLLIGKSLVKRISACAFLGIAATVAACGPGQHLAQPVILPTPSPAPPAAAPTPVALPSTAAFTATQTVPLSIPAPVGTATAAPLAFALPASLPSGFGGQISLPVSQASIPPNTVVQNTVANQSPAGVPVIQQLTRNAAGAARAALLGTGATAIEFVTLSFSNAVTFPSQPAFTFTLPAAYTNIPNVAFFVAEYTMGYSFLGWIYGYEGPGSVSGTTVTFTPAQSPTLFLANQPAYFALYAISVAAPTPTPAPSATALPTAPPLSAQPATVSFAAAGATQTVTIGDASSTYAGGYAAKVDNPTIATVTVSGTALTITSVAAGLTTVTVTTTDGRELLVPVGVTTTATALQ